VKRLEEIEHRKAILIARSAGQRMELGRIQARLERPVQICEQTFRILRKPLVITGLAALLIKTPWKRFAKWPGLLWRGWQLLNICRKARA